MPRAKHRLVEDDIIAEDTLKKQEIIVQANQYIEFYKAGFLDAYRIAKGKMLNWDLISKKCAKCFEKRFNKRKQEDGDALAKTRNS